MLIFADYREKESREVETRILINSLDSQRTYSS